MDEWDLTDLDVDTKARDAERRAALWQTLEGDGTVPGRALIALLSHLVDDDLLRMRALWPHLAPAVRQELTTIMEELSEADFAMDFSAIFRLALSDPDTDVRTTALRGLDEVEDIRLVPEFMHILRRDPSPQARQAAAEGLGRFVLLGELERLRADPFHKVVQALQACYTDPDEDMGVRQRAVEAMAFTGDYGVPTMIKRAYTDGNADMRRSAVIAMGRSADEEWAALVQRELLSTDPRMRLAAVRACGELQIRAAVQEIVTLTDDVDADVQTMSVWALGQIGGTIAKRTLQRFAKGDDEDLATIAEEALQELEFLHGDTTSFFGPPESFNGETDGAWRFPQLGDLADPDADEGADDEEDADDSIGADDADYLTGDLGAGGDAIEEDGSEDDDWDDEYDPFDDDGADEDQS